MKKVIFKSLAVLTLLAMIMATATFAAKKVTIRYTSYLLDTAQAGNTYVEAVEEFKKANPDINVELDFIQNANYTAGVKTRLLGGEPMDVFDTWSPSLFSEFRKLGKNIYLNLNGSSFLKDFHPNTLEPVTVNGKVYGVPELIHSCGLLYNKTMFDKLGIKVPQNWKEFLAVCETLKKNNIIPVAMDGEWWVPQFFWSSIVIENGGDTAFTAKLEKGAVKITDPIFVNAVKKNKELIDKGYIPKDWAGMKHEQAKDLIGQSKAGMLITGTWDIPSVIERDKNMDLDFMIVPGNDSGKPIPNINVGCYRVITAKTKYPAAAKKFVAFMNGRENQMRMAKTAKAFPSTKDSFIDDPILKKVANVVTRPDAVIYWPHTVSVESLQVKILEGVNRILAGADLNKTLAEIQKDIDQARKK